VGTLWERFKRSHRANAPAFFCDEHRWYAYDVVEGESRSTVFGEDVSFGARLRRLREAAGLTQEELAERAGLTRKAISVLERGERKRPYPHTVRSLADALGLPEDERASLLAAVPRREQGNLTSYRPEEEPSPIAPAADVVPTLPAPPTPLVGRERELEEVGRFLASPQTRLLTLTGTGGVGKTRLAIEAVRESAGLFPDGAVFVALAPLGDHDLVLPTVAQSLGLRETGGPSPREVLRTYLREKRFLLALDNFEHVLEAAGELAALIEACQGMTVLATSRAPLRIRGEQEYPVEPLALPASTVSPAAQEVSESSSGYLFAERARATSPAFEITDENASAVAAICWRLSGLPLALELAAAKTRFLDPEVLLSRLDRALSAGWVRDVPERQRTMRSTLDWSHDLLSGGEKALFRRLSVFAGGFTLEAGEKVGASERVVDAEEVLELLGRLTEQSLVIVTQEPNTGTRYGMLEPVRQYALEKLEESGEAGEVRLRHAGYYLALAEEAEPHIKGHEQVAWLDRLEAENDNLRAAIGRSLEAGEAQTAARFGWALGMYWVMRARREEGRLLMEQTLAQGSNLSARTRARALFALALCVNGSREDQRLMAISEESAALFRREGDRHGEAYALLVLSFAALQLGELDRAERVLEESLDGFREHGDEWGSAHSLNHLAVASLRRGDYPRAARYGEEARAVTRRSGDRLGANVALHLLAQAAWASDEPGRAARYFREALVPASESADKTSSAYCIQGLAAVAEARGEPQRAARLLGAAQALLKAAGVPVYVTTDHDLHQRVTSATRERLGEQAWTVAHDEGRAMGFEEAVAYALGKDEALPVGI
jgi:predicted ATPase/transcriptional regulator with XRE-family HTH domain